MPQRQQKALKGCFYIIPLKQGLRPAAIATHLLRLSAFLHHSIKTRIKTESRLFDVDLSNGFYIIPLKQGLRHSYRASHLTLLVCFYIIPLKQGLRQQIGGEAVFPCSFYIIPLQQGLRLWVSSLCY